MTRAQWSRGRVEGGTGAGHGSHGGRDLAGPRCRHARQDRGMGNNGYGDGDPRSGGQLISDVYATGTDGIARVRHR